MKRIVLRGCSKVITIEEDARPTNGSNNSATPLLSQRRWELDEMKKIIIGMILGVTLMAALLIPIAIHERRRSWDYGVTSGRIDGLFEAADALDKEFGRYDGQGDYKLLLSVKSGAIISIVTNGVKTVRIIQ